MRNVQWRFLQLLSGVAVAALLGTHMVSQHTFNIFGGTDPTAFQSMIDRARVGGWVALYIALLAVGLYHGVYGLRDIILETNPSRGVERAVTAILIIVGIIFFGLGTYAPIALFSR